MAYLSLAERKMVGILNAIQPRIRKNVGSNRLRNVILDISHSRPKFHDKAGNTWVQPAGDLTIKLRICLAQQRLLLPKIAVLQNFNIVLFNAKGHGSNDLAQLGPPFG